MCSHPDQDSSSMWCGRRWDDLPWLWEGRLEPLWKKKRFGSEMYELTMGGQILLLRDVTEGTNDTHLAVLSTYIYPLETPSKLER